jgi:hypothetical protein
VHTGRQGGWTPTINHPVVLGEEGFFLLQYTGPQLTQPVQGEYTGAWYKFHQRRTMYVDKRDAVYLMGPDFEMM